MNDDPAARWRALICDRCDECNRQLAFVEGPICDRCLDRDELLPAGADKYAQFRDEKQRWARAREDKEGRPGPRGSVIAHHVDMATREIAIEWPAIAGIPDEAA